MNHREVGWGAWTGSIWLRMGTGYRALVNAVMNLLVPLASQEGLCSIELVVQLTSDNLYVYMVLDIYNVFLLLLRLYDALDALWLQLKHAA